MSHGHETLGLRRLAVGFASLVMFAACTGEAASEGGDESLFDAEPAQRVQVDLDEMAFTPARIEIASGQLAEITLTNGGDATHDFTIDGGGIRSAFRLLEGEPANQQGHGDNTAHVALRSGSTVEFRTEIDAPGEYEFYCSVPGHRAAGMRGTLVVG